MARHICFFTGKRGGFNHLVPVFERIDQEPGLEYSVIAADMHLSPGFGRTVDEVLANARGVHALETMLDSDTRAGRAKSIGIALMGLADLLPRIAPDLAFILGDRGEVLAMAIAALQLNIPLAHLFGGDLTQGGVDEVVRHALTKMANIHFASNPESADRILRLGEDPARVHCVGAPVLDLVRQKRYTSPEEVARQLGLATSRPVAILLQHPVTWQVNQAEAQLRCTLGVLEEAADRDGLQSVAVYPCADPGGRAMVRVLQEYAGRPWLRVLPNLSREDFWGLLDLARVMLGNSSAGVMETASFGTAAIDIGIRQEGRLRVENVLSAEHDRASIRQALHRALHDQGFAAQVAGCKSPYGNGHAAERIVDVLRDTPLEGLERKRITF